MTQVQDPGVGSLTTLLDKGRELLESGNADQAIQLFQQATQVQPRSAKAWNDLGVALHLNQKPNLAIEAFQMAVLVDPGHVDSAINLAVFHYNRGRPIDGFSVLRSAYRRNPKNAELRAEMEEQGLLKWKPVALIWDGGDHQVKEYAARTLKRVGYKVAYPEEPVVAACSPLLTLKPASWVRYFRLVRPTLFLIPPGARADRMALEAARREGIPVHCMADYLPERGWDADLTKVEESLEVILKEVPKAPEREDTSTPIITLIVTATRNGEDCGGVLDRLAIQDLEPGLFEVLVVDDGIRPPVAKNIEPGHFPYFCRLYRSESQGLFAARDRATEDARGKFIFYFSQAERPGPRCLRRMLREYVAENKVSSDLQTGHAAASEPDVPAGQFWQYQLRQVIRDEVGSVIDSRINSVQFGLQMQSLMASADFVRRAVPVHLRMNHAELMETISVGMLESGGCLAFGAAPSKWMKVMAEGLDRSLEGFSVATSAGLGQVEEPDSALGKVGGEPGVCWNPGTTEHAVVTVLDTQPSPLAILVFDRCALVDVERLVKEVGPMCSPGTMIVVRECAEPDEDRVSQHIQSSEWMPDELSVQYLGVATDEDTCIVAMRVH